MPAAKTTAPKAEPDVEQEDGSGDRIATLEDLVHQQAQQINVLQAKPVTAAKQDYHEPLGLRPKGERQEHGRAIVAEWEREAREAEKDAE
jgi:hypothetical protein